MAADFALGEFEQMLLLAILQLGEGASGPSIARYLEERVGRSVSRGALYATLARLEQKGFVDWAIEEADGDRGGHRKRLFALTSAGISTLRTYRSALLRLWSGLEGTLEEAGP
jgi:PadR family transcriptional regulator